MTTFVDTSALYAVLDASDLSHPPARVVWERLLTAEETLLTSNYVIGESFALVQHHLGLQAVRAFQDRVLPVLEVEWVDEADHAVAVQAVLAAGRQELSLVDCVSFQVMRRLGVRSVFAFDEHFQEQGFQVLPE